MSSQPSGRVTILLVSDQPHHFRIREVVFCSDELITQKILSLLVTIEVAG